MLSPPYRWRVEPDRAFLNWNYGTVAHVQPRAGRWEVTINFRGGIHGGPAGSLDQGMRFVERWIEARAGMMPTVRPRRWYDRR